MLFKDIPIRRKLMRVIILIIGVVLFVTCVTFFIYEFFAFRKTTIEKLSTIGKIIAANSTAALAFDDRDDAKEILAALKTEPHIIAAALYDKKGNIFSQYPANLDIKYFPAKPGIEGYQFAHAHVEGFQPVVEETRQLGILYLESDLGAMYERFRLYGIIVAFVVILSFLLAYLLSKILQKSISKPILSLAETATTISDGKDYSVRAVKMGKDEVGSLTDAFNSMLGQIETQNRILNEFNQNLEQKVRNRTMELETVNKELEAFSYSISHDLRAPLRIITGFASILESDYGSTLDDEGKRVITVINRNTNKMGRLIDDLLSFSRTGRQDIVKARMSMTIMVNEMITELTHENRKPEVKWVVTGMPDVKGDVTAMRQVWMNLLSNAVKYSANREEPRIEVGSSNNDGQTIFFVKDNGVGFDAKYKHKLFKVFQRLHSSAEFEGTGVGLAIVEKIISKHGGSVWVEAELGKGACFYFSLPDG